MSEVHSDPNTIKTVKTVKPTPSRCQPTFGTHREFADLYEKFLDAAYSSSAKAEPGTGRWLLIRQVANEIRLRGAREVLDCAAGTGFPAIDLAANASDYGIETLHFTDGDPEMIRVLRRRAKKLNVELPEPIPRPSKGSAPETDGDPLIRTWADLGGIRRDYDYVLCRGNSLAYADTWTGDHQVASCETIGDYLKQIAIKVRPGGFLHIDAPWEAKLKRRKYQPVASGALSIWEEVVTEADHRHWRVDFKPPRGQTLKFERYSSRVTIYQLADALSKMGFEETKPFPMTGERPNFGVIIARRPSSCRPSYSRPGTGTLR